MDALRWMCFVMGICSSWNFGYTEKPNMKIQYGWGQLEYEWTEAEKQEAITSGTYIPNIPAPIDVDVYYSPDSSKENKIFVTIPKFQAGIPASLATVTDQVSPDGNPIIKPYPDWSWHQNPQSCNANRIVSVYRVMIDECNRLWVLDNGRFIDNIVCPPQILTFDLRTNELIKAYELPKDQYEERSIFVTPVIDNRNQCTDTFVYAADCQTYSIIVYDYNQGTSWRVTDKTLYPYPNYGTYRILGEHFDLMDGVLGMALEPLRPDGDRKLFYHAMSSPTENWVWVSHLRNQTRFIGHPDSSPDIFHTFRGTRDTQSAAEAIDKDGILYAGLMSEVELICWNTRSEEYGRKHWEVIGNNKTNLQFASGMKIKTNRKGYQELWVMTSRFQKVAAGSINVQDINFRILVARVDDLLYNTKCKKRSTFGGNGGGYGLRPPPNRY